jgi:hypothetical protein
VTDKLTHIHDRIYCCRSGSAADTQAIADIVHYYAQMFEYAFCCTAHLLRIWPDSCIKGCNIKNVHLYTPLLPCSSACATETRIGPSNLHLRLSQASNLFKLQGCPLESLLPVGTSGTGRPSTTSR